MGGPELHPGMKPGGAKRRPLQHCAGEEASTPGPGRTEPSGFSEGGSKQMELSASQVAC